MPAELLDPLFAIALPAGAIVLVAALAARLVHPKERLVVAGALALAGAFWGWRAVGPGFVAAPNGVAAVLGALAYAALGALPVLRAKAPGVAGAGVTLALLVLALTWLSTRASLPSRTAAEASEGEARWAVRLDPWEPGGWLALAWHARSQDAYDAARTQLE
ncbi:MAG: hypothetical protein AAGH15_26430, partial [Myxococcota bacterium]